MSFLNDRAPAIRRRRTALVIAVAALTSIGVVGVAHAASPSPAREPSDCVPYRWWTCWWGTTTTTAPAGTDDTTPPTGDTTPPTGSTPVSDETTPPTGDTTTPTSPPESTVAPTSTATTTPTPSTTPTTPGGPGCGLGDAAAFCETFDAPHNGGTQTGDLDPVLWGVSRVADANPGSEINGIVPSHNACANGAPTPPPADAQICNGQYVESLNDGGSVATINAYPKQPFSFAGRTGTVVFDVSADSEGTHAAWPEFVITGEPVPGVRREISVQPTPHAINEIGFALDTGCAGQDDTTGVGVIFTSVNNVYQEVQNSRPNCITKGSSAAMNHIEVRVSTTHIEVWGTDAGSTTLKQLAVEDIPGGLAFSQGLVWLDDAHYNARKSIEPCACGTQFDHSFAWDNLGFDGPKTYRDRGFDIELGNALSGRSIQGDAQVQLGFSAPTDGVSRTVTGVEWSQTPTSVKVVMNAYSFDETQPQVSINGGPFHTIPWDAPNDSTYAWRSLSIPNIPMSEVHAGTNTITFKGSSSTIIANPSLILVAAAPVP